jgi:hypothetical protein
MRRLTALLMRLAFSASARALATARGERFSRLARSKSAASSKAMPGKRSQRSLSMVS